MKGVVKDSNVPTSLLLPTPAAKATNPLTKVARPKMEDSSDESSPLDCDEETSHDSKAEKRIDVEIPPRTRPRYKT